ncbi:MAG: hypothetical protein RL708_1020 [Bacteroidota bacterium]|jgi:hypothetical protein
MKRQIIKWTVLVLLFGISLIIRKPLFNRALSDHHEWLTAHTLITFDIWNKKGIANCHYAPIYTYPLQSNKHILSLGGVNDKLGDGYYVSYPPFGFILPYFFIQTFNLPIAPWSLELFNLLLHFLGGLIIYHLIKNNTVTKKYWLHPAALAAFIAYTFSASTLWFLCNAYFVDMQAQFFLIAVIYCWIKIQTSTIDKSKFKGYVFALVILYFCLCFTEWIGFLLGITFFIYTLINHSFYKNLRLLLMLLAMALSALLLTLFMYAKIDGLTHLHQAIAEKYISRSGWNNDAAESQLSIFSTEGINSIIHHYKSNFAPLIKWLFVMILLVVGLHFSAKKTIKSILHKSEINLLLIAAMPILLHHILLFNFTAVHDFSTTKTAILFSIMAAIVVDKLFENIIHSKLYLLLFFVVSSFYGYKMIEQYYLMNKPNYDTLYFKSVATEIAKSNDDEVVFLNQENKYMPWNLPQYIFYSKRNCMPFENDSTTLIELKKMHQTKARIIDIPWNDGKVFSKNFSSRIVTQK